MAIIDFMGYRVLAMTLLPITKQTLLYGGLFPTHFFIHTLLCVVASRAFPFVVAYACTSLAVTAATAAAEWPMPLIRALTR